MTVSDVASVLPARLVVSGKELIV